MKTAMQDETAGKSKNPTGLKSGKRNVKSVPKSRSKANDGTGENIVSMMSDYSTSAQRVLKRGRSGAAKAYNWVSETGHAIPDTLKNSGITDARSAQAYIGDRPLVLGVIGVGIGIAIGAMLPTLRAPPKAVAKKSRSR